MKQYSQSDRETEPDFEKFASLSLATSFSYFGVMSKALQRDAKRCMAMCHEARSPLLESRPLTPAEYHELIFWYGNLVRAFVSEVEGLLYVMRRIIIWAHGRDEVELTPGEAVLVREIEYRFDAKRKRVEEREGRHNRLLENFLLVFQLLPRVFRSSFSLDLGTRGWAAFQKVVEVRNAITHPKTPKDTLLDASLFAVIPDAAGWWYGSVSGFLGTVDTKLLEESARKLRTKPELRELLESCGFSRPGGAFSETQHPPLEGPGAASASPKGG